MSRNIRQYFVLSFRGQSYESFPGDCKIFLRFIFIVLAFIVFWILFAAKNENEGWNMYLCCMIHCMAYD